MGSGSWKVTAGDRATWVRPPWCWHASRGSSECTVSTLSSSPSIATKQKGNSQPEELKRTSELRLLSRSARPVIFRAPGLGAEPLSFSWRSHLAQASRCLHPGRVAGPSWGLGPHHFCVHTPVQAAHIHRRGGRGGPCRVGTGEGLCDADPGLFLPLAGRDAGHCFLRTLNSNMFLLGAPLCVSVIFHNRNKD